MDTQLDEVLLDGHNEIQQWPVALAKSLLDDTTSWAQDRFRDFYYLATCVNGYNRHPFGDEWGPHLLREIESGGPLQKYATQELLDLVFIICRADRFSDGLIKNTEAQLRKIVQEVTRRVESDSPPTFSR
jgi:hypothetical protein